MASKTSTSWRLKEALLLLAPYLLYAVIILMPVLTRVYVNPLTRDLSCHLGEMEEHTADHSSAEYATLLEETRHDATRLLVISIAVALVTITLAFAGKIIVARCFNAASGSGDLYSLAELLREVTKWRNLKTSAVTTAVVVVVALGACMELLGGNFATVIDDSGLLSVRGSLILVTSLAFLYMGALAMMGVARKRNDLAALVLAAILLPALLIPVCELAVLYLYTEQVMGLGLSLLSVYDILQAVQSLLCFLAANVYHDGYYKARSAMEESSKEDQL
uniref:Uncharacterized protein n=1 Tax=Avena sativa TaxID=4498 RepID=A0ACD5UIL9_AVESA